MAQTTFTDGDVLTATLLNTYCSGEGGAWSAFTPQIDQGATTDIAKTINYSKYARYGRTIHWSFKLTLTAAGTAGSNVTVSLPVEAAASSPLVGTGQVYDASTVTSYTHMLLGASVSLVIWVASQASANGWGNTPNLALASGDTLMGSITYEAAS